MSSTTTADKSFFQRLLDGVEVVGNKVPHPVVIFVILIGIVIVLSQILFLLGTSVSYEIIDLETHKAVHVTTAARGLLTVDGIRFMFTGVVQNLMNFNAVGVIIVAMVRRRRGRIGRAGEGTDPQAGRRRAAEEPSPTSWFLSESSPASPPTPATSS